METQTNQQFHSKGVLLMLDPPQGLEFGIDNISWQIGKMFKGLKLIPLGVHYISYSLKEEGNMFKISRFINFTKEKSIHVHKWNQTIECFKELKGEEAEGFRHGVRNYHFDSYLGVYPDQNVEFWSQNTNYITKQVLDKLDPLDPIQLFQQEYTHSIQPQREASEMPLDVEDQAHQQVVEQQESQQKQEQADQKKQSAVSKFKQLSDNIYYSQIPRKLKEAIPKNWKGNIQSSAMRDQSDTQLSPLNDSNANGNCIETHPQQLQHVSLVNLDKTGLLNYVIHHSWKTYPKGILGQIQYSFVSFLVGENQQSYSQWKKLVNLFSQSEKAFNQNCQLMLDFLIVFYQQLNQFPADFFRDELSKQSFLVQCLRKLKLYTVEESIPKKAIKRVKKLLEMVEKKFDYCVQIEDEDQGPVVVQQREIYF